MMTAERFFAPSILASMVTSRQREVWMRWNITLGCVRVGSVKYTDPHDQIHGIQEIQDWGVQ